MTICANKEIEFKFGSKIFEWETSGTCHIDEKGIGSELFETTWKKTCSSNGWVAFRVIDSDDWWHLSKLMDYS